MFPLLYIGAIKPDSPEELFSRCFPSVLRVVNETMAPIQQKAP